MHLGVMRFAGKNESVSASGQSTYTVTYVDDRKNKLTVRVAADEYRKWGAGMTLDPSTLFPMHQRKLGEEGA